MTAVAGQGRAEINHGHAVHRVGNEGVRVTNIHGVSLSRRSWPISGTFNVHVGVGWIGDVDDVHPAGHGGNKSLLTKEGDLIGVVYGRSREPAFHRRRRRIGNI
ncbi:MAG: hypothetical protein WDN00_15075 [Limisphaerales bacterium]